MSNVEHAFENCLFKFMRTGELPNVKKNDEINSNGLDDKTIEIVEDCALYMIGKIADYDKEIMYKILHN